MEIFPAIDLFEAKAVRLLRGDYRQMTVYSDDPSAVARDFAAYGARYAHLVDLEGAKDGTTPNLQTVERIAKESGLRVEIGGGIRSEETARRYLDAGVWRVILGTAAVEDPALLERLAGRFGDRVAVGIDVRGGMVATRGWLKDSGVMLEALCGRLLPLGLTGVIVTDITKDGAMGGSNLELYRGLGESFPQLKVTASGGVSSHEDLAALRDSGCWGAIVGKAYYTGAVDLRRAIEENT
ncbi:MAG: 1-(5-phosphoribosyl)-5-[Clostridia bacterium]|nr:1-(5-phosphoribosyl)-5-[(5-phosphoribosylamino)methylideneamino]imidazole-4-carboxamide isomerase [Clostridia bacterium]